MWMWMCVCVCVKRGGLHGDKGFSPWCDGWAMCYEKKVPSISAIPCRHSMPTSTHTQQYPRQPLQTGHEHALRQIAELAAELAAARAEAVRCFLARIGMFCRLFERKARPWLGGGGASGLLAPVAAPQRSTPCRANPKLFSPPTPTKQPRRSQRRASEVAESAQAALDDREREAAEKLRQEQDHLAEYLADSLRASIRQALHSEQAEQGRGGRDGHGPDAHALVQWTDGRSPQGLAEAGAWPDPAGAAGAGVPQGRGWGEDPRDGPSHDRPLAGRQNPGALTPEARGWAGGLSGPGTPQSAVSFETSWSDTGGWAWTAGGAGAEGGRGSPPLVPALPGDVRVLPGDWQAGRRTRPCLLLNLSLIHI